jgi:DNA-binding response OmpR family regulator
VPPERNGLRILVVDDDAAMGLLLGTVITEAGYHQPATVKTGADAIVAAESADVILLDHQLPDTTGLDLLPALRTAAAQPSIILVTAHGDEALAVRALRAGADDYVIKDASLTKLLPEVIERVRRHRALREALAAAERDLVHAERLAAIGQVNVALHHSINNPLMTAFAELQLLLTSPLLPDQKASVESIRTALGQVREILQRLSGLREVRTTNYLDGIPMLDLSRRSQPMPVQLGEAAVWFPEPDISRVVGMLLSHAGFEVERVNTVEELTTRAQRLNTRLVVVGGGALANAEPLSGFVPAKGRFYTLVALVPDDGSRARAAGADHVVPLPFDPGTFVSDVLGAMHT